MSGENRSARRKKDKRETSTRLLTVVSVERTVCFIISFASCDGGISLGIAAHCPPVRRNLDWCALSRQHNKTTTMSKEELLLTKTTRQGHRLQINASLLKSSNSDRPFWGEKRHGVV